MKPSSNKSRKEKGSVLLLSIFVVVIATAIVAAAHFATTGQAMLTSRSADIDSLETTAEGLLEYAYGAWKQAMLSSTNGQLNTAAANQLVSGNNRPAVPANMQIVDLSIAAVDAYGVPSGNATKVVGLSENPPGWQASTYNYLARVTLRMSGVGGQREVSMQRMMRHDLIPPVGGLFFSEGNFELYKPAPMIVDGNVHTNQDTHISTHYNPPENGLKFLAGANVSYVGTYDNLPPEGATRWSPAGSGDTNPPYYERGFENQVSRTDRIEAIGLGTTADYDTTDANPNNDGNRELIEPPVAGYSDPEALANSRIYNNAGLIVQVNGAINPSAALTNPSPNVFTGGNLTIKARNGTTLTAAQAEALRNAISNSTLQQVTEWQPNLVWVEEEVWVPNLVEETTQVWVESGYYERRRINGRWTYVWVDTSHWETKTVIVDRGHYETQGRYVDQGQWVTRNQYVQKTLYDKRELSEIPITDLDLAAMNPTLNTLAGFNDILYVHDTGSGGKKAIRVVNGGVLPNDGLTLATENGLYIKGDFNTGTTSDPNAVPSNNGGNAGGTDQPYVSGYTPKPAALAADAVMILSNSWSDANDDKSLSYRNASHTTVNTAIIAGYIAGQNAAFGRSGYSGGMNNFPRFLETWSGDYLTFNGAFVQVFKSKTFTGLWDTGDIYSPPYRVWKFDRMLLERVIPGIPPASAFSRGRLVKL